MGGICSTNIRDEKCVLNCDQNFNIEENIWGIDWISIAQGGVK